MTGDCLGAFEAFKRRAAQPQAEAELVEAQERHAAVPTLCTLARLGQDEREQPHPVRAQFCQNARTEVRQRLPAAVVARPADHEPGPIRVEAPLWNRSAEGQGSDVGLPQTKRVGARALWLACAWRNQCTAALRAVWILGATCCRSVTWLPHTRC
jgi:hypothetical protein